MSDHSPAETVKLKPCPFCGSPGRLVTGSNNCNIGCCGSDCPADPFVAAGTAEEVVALWNRRAPFPSGESAERGRAYWRARGHTVCDECELPLSKPVVPGDGGIILCTKHGGTNAIDAAQLESERDEAVEYEKISRGVLDSAQERIQELERQNNLLASQRSAWNRRAPAPEAERASLRDLLRTVEELHGKATKGPLVPCDGMHVTLHGVPSPNIVFSTACEIRAQSMSPREPFKAIADRNLIVALWNAAPALLALARGEESEGGK